MAATGSSLDQQVRACLDATLSPDEVTRRAAEEQLGQLYLHDGEWRGVARRSLPGVAQERYGVVDYYGILCLTRSSSLALMKLPRCQSFVP